MWVCTYTLCPVQPNLAYFASSTRKINKNKNLEIELKCLIFILSINKFNGNYGKR